MTGHTPYIMPDGRPLTNYLKAESVSGANGRPKKKGSGLRGKDHLWDQILSHRSKLGTSSDLSELAELKMLEAAGVRRRRRWLNDKVLRDMAGPMTATDMEGLFKPAPFGESGHMSALTLASQPEHSGVWEHFRSIDPDKEAKVLQKWSEYNQGQRGSKAQEPAPAAIALGCWSRVGKKARLALRKANVHTVLQLELQLLDYLELADSQPLSMALEDAYARLLVHGLAEFYNLLSASKSVGAETHLVISHKSPPQPYIPSITCTDVLLAMSEVGQLGLNQQLLQQYVKTNIHGSDAGSVKNLAVGLDG